MPASSTQRCTVDASTSRRTPRASSTSAEPTDDEAAIAVLGDTNTAAGDGEGRHRRDVHRVELITTVPTRSMALGPTEKVAAEHHGVNETSHLIGRLALGRQGREKAGDQHAVDVTEQDLVSASRACSRSRFVRARGD